MKQIKRKFSNRYWLYDVEQKVHKLFLKIDKYEEPQELLMFIKATYENLTPNRYYYYSDLLNVVNNYEDELYSDEEAMIHFENMIREYIEEIISSHDYMLEKFNEE